ncbi:MAG: TPM domain-containing protein [Oligosphaeraceae bacterium]
MTTCHPRRLSTRLLTLLLACLLLAPILLCHAQQPPADDENAAAQPTTPRRHATIPDPGVPFPYDGDIPPKPSHRRFVLDWGQLLTPEDRAFVEQLGRQLEQLTSAELVLVTVPTRGDIPIKDFSFNLASSWGIGKRDKDNGCLLLAVADRLRAHQSGKTRIEVGKGLEGRLNDAKCGRILDEIALPPFAADNPSLTDTSAGLAEAYAYLAAQIAAEYNQSLGQDFDQNYAELPPPQEIESTDIGDGLALLIIVGFFAILFILDRFKLLGSSSRHTTRGTHTADDDGWSSSSGDDSGSDGGDFGGGDFGGGGADR